MVEIFKLDFGPDAFGNSYPKYKEVLNWKIHDDGNSTWAKINYRGLVAHVTDCDGDGSEWYVSTKEKLNAEYGPFYYAEGSIMSGEAGDLYHFDAAMIIVEWIIYHMSGDSSNSPFIRKTCDHLKR